MAQNVRLGDYQAILSRMQTAQQTSLVLPTPFKGAVSLDVFKKTIADGRTLLPARYQKPYVDVLEHAVLQAEEALKIIGPRAQIKRRAVFQQLELVFTALAAPIAQMKSQTHNSELKAFLAVISDVYRHFVDNRKIRAAAKSQLLWPSLDPLGSFNSDSRTGPYTFPASAELPVALISKPVGQSTFLPLWLIDGHEVGGHSIFTGVDGFLPEIGDVVESRIRAAFGSDSLKISSKTVTFAVATGTIFAGQTDVPMVDFMCKVWRAWLQEASADTAGLLNMGPMFTDGLLLTLALQTPQWELSSRSVFDSRRGFTDHPTDLVRALLNIEMLKKTGGPRAASYAKAIRERLLELQMDMPTHVTWVSRTGAPAAAVALADMQAILPVVADALLHSSLSSLSGNSLLSLMPWTNADEKAVRMAAAALLRGDTQPGENVQARHIVAGAMLAAERASDFENFESSFKLLHNTGLTILNDMYSGQCLLCNVQSLRNGAKNPAEVSLKDLVRLVKNMRLKD